LVDHKWFISSLNIMFYKEHDDAFRWYWIPKLHKNPSRGNNTAGAFFFSRKRLTAVRDGIQSYSHTNHIVVSIKYGYWNTGSYG